MMIPAGYMAKFVADRPDWLGAAGVKDVYSLSACVSSCFADDCHTEWRHNGFWLFDSIDVIQEIAAKKSVDLTDASFFYCETYEWQFDDEGREGALQAPDQAFATNVANPEIKTLRGFDVVTFYSGSGRNALHFRATAWPWRSESINIASSHRWMRRLRI